MKICHISTVHSLNDNRVFHKECKGLAQAGHEVILVINHDRDEVIDGVRIVGLSKPRNRFERIFCTSFKALYYALKQKAEVYHFHDPELIPIGLILKLLRNTVIYDVHENVPQQILNKDWLGHVWARKVAAFGAAVSEKIGKIFFDVIVVARPDLAEHFNCDKTRVIINAADLKTIDGARDIHVEKQKPAIVYAGLLRRIRGIRELIQAMEIVGDEAELWLLGIWYPESFQRECENLAGWKHVKFLGYKNIEDVYGYMKKGDIGIVTYLPVPNHLTTLPNKPFEYMACRLPIIMSNFEYWRNIFKDYALFVDPEDPKQIAESISYLLRDRELMMRLGSAGRELVESKYCWEREEEKLLEMYDSLRKL